MKRVFLNDYVNFIIGVKYGVYYVLILNYFVVVIYFGNLFDVYYLVCVYLIELIFCRYGMRFLDYN